INLINTAFHFSSLVVRTDILKQSINCIRNGNPYDTDRLIPVELGRYGKVICDSRPQLYIRSHGGREANRIVANGEASYWWQTSTQQLFALADEMNIDLKREFALRTSRQPLEGDVLRRLRGSISNWNHKGLIEKDFLALPEETNRPSLV